MRAGRMRQRITIQKPVTVNTYGNITTTWGTYCTVWASIEPLRGREYFEADIQTAEITHRIMIRYKPGIKESMRISYGNRTFMIKSIINKNEKNVELEIMCEENTGDV